MKKRYTVRVTYVGEIDAESEEKLEEKLWEVHKFLCFKPYDEYLFEAEEVEIELEE